VAPKPPHFVCFVPGLFGFGQLAGYDYFQHLRRALEREFAARDIVLLSVDAPTPPTSSLRYRAEVVARTIANEAPSDAPIHIVGHSTGGLDARLLLSPSAQLRVPPELLSFRSRVQTITTLNTPHYGTPLASYFATVSGARLLYALSLLTIISLKLGEPSLSIFARILAGAGTFDALLGGDGQLFSRLTGGILRFVAKERRGEILDYLSKVQTDQGAILQISPESMDIFNGAVPDAAHVRYGSVVSLAPTPGSLAAARRIRSPSTAFSVALYTMLYQFAGQPHERYGYARVDPSTLGLLKALLGEVPTDTDSDGIVPTRSMLWGQLVATVEADHLDTLGHFLDNERPSIHTDWLTSGSGMTRFRFRDLVKKIAAFQLASFDLASLDLAEPS
jgi:triacylglycerol lipase